MNAGRGVARVVALSLLALLLAGVALGCGAEARRRYAAQALESCQARHRTDHEACAAERAELSRAERALQEARDRD